MVKTQNIQLSDVHNDLVAIRKMMILLLLSQGLSQDLIDKAVGMGPANMRGLFPKKQIKKSIQKWNEGAQK